MEKIRNILMDLYCKDCNYIIEYLKSNDFYEEINLEMNNLTQKEKNIFDSLINKKDLLFLNLPKIYIDLNENFCNEIKFIIIEIINNINIMKNIRN